jgi:hypothetical protein
MNWTNIAISALVFVAIVAFVIFKMYVKRQAATLGGGGSGGLSAETKAAVSKIDPNTKKMLEKSRDGLKPPVSG